MSTNSPTSRPVGPAVVVRFWAAARAAAGVEQTVVSARTVQDVVDDLTGRMPAVAPILALSTLLVDGVRADPAQLLEDGQVLEVLPPFAGG